MGLLPTLRLQVLGVMDLTGIAQRVASLHGRGVPIARSDDEPGLITFLARLPEPLAAAQDPMAWEKQHPDGYFLFYSGRGSVPPGVEDSAKFANRWVGLVSSRAALANPKLLERLR